MTADTAPSSPSADAPVGAWAFWAGAVAVAAGTFAYLVLVLGLSPDAPTIAMAAAVIVLMVALRSLFRVVFALGFESAELWADAAASSGSAANERRAEYKRVLRAIKQLDEDYEVGKLADADHKSLREGLTLRAVELKRELTDVAKSDELHPKLQALLAGEPEAPACPGCGTVNDADARFCKSCGHNFETAAATADETTAGETEASDAQEASA